MRAADVLFVSVPKCGRTWVRTFLHAYFSARAGLEMTFDHGRLAPSGAPRVEFTHDRWEQRATPHLWRRLRGADLVPADRRRRGTIALLVRDPRDLLVSLYFQLTRREHWHRGDLPALLRHPRFGAGSVVRAMNEWLTEWGTREGFEFFRYEDLRAEPGAAFRSLLEFVGHGADRLDEQALAQALRFSRFDNMQQLERSGAFGHGTLRAGDPTDRDSYKMRRGQVGAFADYLGADDVSYVERHMRALDPRLGYGSRSDEG